MQTREQFDREALTEDVRELVDEIDRHHVDPFVGYDSRVAFRARAEETVRDLPESASPEEAFRRIAPLVAGLRDAHSRVHPPEPATETSDESDGQTADGGESEPERFPLSLRVIGEALFVESVTDERLEPFVGHRLVAVEGVPTATLADRLRRYYGAENDYGALAGVSWRLRRPAHAARLLERDEPQTELSITFETDAGEETVTIEARPPGESVASTTPSVAHPEGSGPRFRLYADGDAAVFVPGRLQAYREALEVVLAHGAGEIEQWARHAYKRQVGGEPPDDPEEAIAALPSMAETIHDATAAMQAADTETLIVDLRDNPGGSSRYATTLAHALFGPEGLGTAVRSVTTAKRRTDAHRDRFGDDSPLETELVDEYDLSEYLDLPASADPVEVGLERLRESETAAQLLDEGRETIYEPPQVVVAVSASTMSSAFAGVAGLSTLGADVVGVPSGQAPVSFGEPVERTLSNTGLTVSLSGSLFEWVPDPDGPVLPVDAELTPELYERYDRAADAGLRLAFDHADVDGAPPEPVE